MKKIFSNGISLLLVATMFFSLVSCGKNDKKSESTTEPTTDATEVSVNRNQPDWIDSAVLYEVNIRQYTEEGTFKAFSEHLTRLKDMGITTLWFMPIYPIAQENKKGTLGSYYSIQDYKSVNSEFGTMDDFKELLNQAHDMGFTVILDWVANHTGWDHNWITEHPEYYMKNDEGKIISPLGQDWVDCAQLDYSNPDTRTAMIDCMKFWINDIGVDGFRCDYAQGLPIDFWTTAREELDKIKPIFMLAEDGTRSTQLLTEAFDCNYNFPLYDLFTSIPKGVVKANDLKYNISEDLPAGSFTMNFLDNHDKNSWNRSMEERFGKEPIGALTTLMFTAEGMPLLYSGQEEGLDKSLEFFEKDNIDFGDYEYSDLITRLCTIKKNNSALYNGNAGAKVVMLENDNKKVLSFSRTKDQKQITVIINLSADEQSVSFDKKISKSNVLIHGDTTGILDSSDETITSKQIKKLSAWEYYILETDLD